jgi:hypothetical protein
MLKKTQKANETKLDAAQELKNVEPVLLPDDITAEDIERVQAEIETPDPRDYSAECKAILHGSKIKDPYKRAMLRALEKNLGIVTESLRRTGTSRNQHLFWLENDPDYAEAYRSIEEIALDFAEGHLHKLIKEGSPAATIFYLKTKGKKRGYIERHELSGPDNQPIIQIIGNI